MKTPLVYLRGTPIWRPENSANIRNLLRLSRRLIIGTEQTSIYVRTFPNALTSKKAQNHKCIFFKKLDRRLAPPKPWTSKCSGFQTKHAVPVFWPSVEKPQQIEAFGVFGNASTTAVEQVQAQELALVLGFLLEYNRGSQHSWLACLQTCGSWRLPFGVKAIPFFFSFTVECTFWFWVGRSEKQKKKRKYKIGKLSGARRPATSA